MNWIEQYREGLPERFRYEALRPNNGHWERAPRARWCVINPDGTRFMLEYEPLLCANGWGLSPYETQAMSSNADLRLGADWRLCIWSSPYQPALYADAELLEKNRKVAELYAWLREYAADDLEGNGEGAIADAALNVLRRLYERGDHV